MPLFENMVECEFAIAERSIEITQMIRLANPDKGKNDPLWPILMPTSSRPPPDVSASMRSGLTGSGFINKTVAKGELSDIIWHCYKVSGQSETVDSLDRLKGLGFKEATRAGISIWNYRHGDPERRSRPNSRTPTEADRRRPEAVQPRYHHRRRALQQAHRYLEATSW